MNRRLLKLFLNWLYDTHAVEYVCDYVGFHDSTLHGFCCCDISCYDSSLVFLDVPFSLLVLVVVVVAAAGYRLLAGLFQALSRLLQYDRN